MHHFGIGHLVPDALQHRRHFQRDGACHDHQVRLPRAGTEDLRSEARDIEARSARGDHLDGATGQPEGERPDGGFSRPVENVIDRCGNDIAIELVLDQSCHDTLPGTVILSLRMFARRQQHIQLRRQAIFFPFRADVCDQPRLAERDPAPRSGQRANGPREMRIRRGLVVTAAFGEIFRARGAVA